MKNKAKEYFSNHALFILMTVAVLASAISFVWYYFGGYILVYGDAASHLNISRRVIDNLTPGVAQLGGYWLPIFHILMLLFAWNDYLWRSGLAGSIISTISFICASYYCFKLIEAITQNRIAALMGSFVFVFNPNILYLQAIPMGESLFLFTAVASIYYLVIWSTKNNILCLIFSAIFAFMSALNRYEGWAILLTEVVIVAVYSYRKNGLKNSEGTVLVFSSVALFAPFIWLIWNFAIFGDPLVFMHGEFSSRGQQEIFESHGLLPTVGNLWLSVKYYCLAIAENNGYVFSILGVAALPFLIKKREWQIAILSFFSIIIFEIVCLYKGITILYIPYLAPFGRLFNVRYGIFAIFIFSISIAYLLSEKKLERVRSIVFVLVSCLFIFQAMLFTKAKPISLREPIMINENRGNIELQGAKYINKEYKGGHILIMASVSEPLILFSGLDIKEYISEGNADLWKKALEDPAKYSEWIIADEDKEDGNVIKKINNNFSIQDNYNLVFSKNGLSIFKRNNS